MLLLLLMTGAEEFYGAPNEENMAKCNFLWMWQHQMLLPVFLVKITTNNIISYLGGHIIPGNPNSRTCWLAANISGRGIHVMLLQSTPSSGVFVFVIPEGCTLG